MNRTRLYPVLGIRYNIRATHFDGEVVRVGEKSNDDEVVRN